MAEETLTLTKSFRWQVRRPLVAGEVITSEGDPEVPTLTLLVVGSDNAEGWGSTADLPALTYPRRLSPYTHPYDESIAVPRTPNVVGPALLLADRIVGRGQYGRVTVISTAEAGVTLANLYGTTGEDGVYATQRNLPAVCGGKEGSNPAPFLLPGDDYLVLMVLGEKDAEGAPVDWGDRALTFFDHIHLNNFPSSNCLGLLFAQLPPNAPDNAVPSITHPGWETVRSEQAALEARGVSPKRIMVPLVNGDRITSDRVHIATGGTDRAGWRRWALAAEAELVSSRVIR